MKNSILYIIGAIALLGGGAYLFLKNKNFKDTIKLADLEQEKAIAVEKLKESKPVEKLLSANDLLVIAKLKDAIIAETKLRNSYKKASSKANIQVLIDEKNKALAQFGFALDMNNQLIKIK